MRTSVGVGTCVSKPRFFMLSFSRSSRAGVAAMAVLASTVTLAATAEAANVPFTLNVATNGGSCAARYVVTYQGQPVQNATVATNPSGTGCIATGYVNSSSTTATTTDFTIGLAPAPLPYSVVKFGFAKNTYTLYVTSGTGAGNPCGTSPVTVLQLGQPLSSAGTVSATPGPGSGSGLCTIVVNTPTASSYPKADFSVFIGGKKTDFQLVPT